MLAGAVAHLAEHVVTLNALTVVYGAMFTSMPHTALPCRDTTAAGVIYSDRSRYLRQPRALETHMR